MVNAIILDKTGTITEGKPIVTNDFWTEETLILKQILSSIEKQSEHPLADAVVSHLKIKIPFQFLNLKVSQVKEQKLQLMAKPISLETKDWYKENEIVIENEVAQKANQWGNEAKTVIWFANTKR